MASTKIGKFTFAVPEGHPEQGKKIEKGFDYLEIDAKDSDAVEQARKIVEDKKWDFVEMVNDKLRANARSNAYQAALLPYRPTDVTAEQVKERMIRDYIRLGINEEVARKQVEALLAASASA